MRKVILALCLFGMATSVSLAHQYSKDHSHCHGSVKPAWWNCADGK
jgi:hypothetical protein